MNNYQKRVHELIENTKKPKINDLIVRLNKLSSHIRGGCNCGGGCDDNDYGEYACYLRKVHPDKKYRIKENSAYLCNKRLFSARDNNEMIDYLEWLLRENSKDKRGYDRLPIGSADDPFTQNYLNRAMGGYISGFGKPREKASLRLHMFIHRQANKVINGKRNACSSGLEKKINEIVRRRLECSLEL